MLAKILQLNDFLFVIFTNIICCGIQLLSIYSLTALRLAEAFNWFYTNKNKQNAIFVVATERQLFNNNYYRNAPIRFIFSTPQNDIGSLTHIYLNTW